MLTHIQSRLARVRWPARLSVVGWLRLTWIVTLLWCEFGSFYASLWGCKWPDRTLQSSGDITHVLLVTDPQVRHLPRIRRRWIDKWRFSIFHRTLQKNWQFAYGLSPDAVVFLGDMLAHGHYLDEDAEYSQYVQRFQQLLPVDEFVSTYYAPGNEDVGLRINVKAARAVRRRFVDHFGPLNQALSISGHNLVLLDAPGLVEEDYHRAEQGLDLANITASPGGALEFVQQLVEHGSSQPTILLTHIPLARPELASCGTLREHGSIRRGVGAGYQNTIGKRTTHFLLKDVHPVIVFSGDDRDYCDYTHRSTNDLTSSDGIREVTVKSFSPFRAINHPGFHLLSLVDPLSTPRLESPTFADQACLLPDYRDVYTSRYLPLAIFTLVVLLISKRRQRLSQSTRLPSYRTISPTDADDDVERLANQSGGKKWQWSPHGHLTKQGSMYESLPASLRAPSSVKEARIVETPLRASLHGSSPLLPDFLANAPSDLYTEMAPVDLQKTPGHLRDDSEDFDREDHMCPAHYTPRSFPSSTSSSSPGSRDGCTVDLSSSWLSDTPTIYFSDPSQRKRWWKWSWSFVFRGRRRRMTITLPLFWQMLRSSSSSPRRTSLSTYHEADWAEKFGLTGKKRISMTKDSNRPGWLRVVRDALVAYWHVSWPAIAMWLFLFYRNQV